MPGNKRPQNEAPWWGVGDGDTGQVGLGLASLCKFPQLGDRGCKVLQASLPDHAVVTAETAVWGVCGGAVGGFGLAELSCDHKG